MYNNVNSKTMIDQLINTAKQQLTPSLKQQHLLNDTQVNDTFNVAKNSLMDGIKNLAATGNLSQITNIFNGKETNTSFLTNDVTKKFIGQLASKIGIPPEKASSIAAMVVPFLINKFASKDTGTVENEGGLMDLIGLGSGSPLSEIGNKLGGLFG
jgi:hypothetical protein